MKRSIGLFLSLFILSTASAKDLYISATNTTRIEYYKVTGDESAQAYQYHSYQPYDEFNFNFTYTRNPYDKVRGQLFGVLSDSMYRTGKDDGFVPERMNLFWEKGDIAVPFRIQVGDYYAFFSYRTLQRSLKGAQVELQPDLGGPFSHSIMFIIGANQPSWRHFDFDENITTGFSYLIEDRHGGRYAFNFVNNSRQADRNAGTLSRRQQVYSLAFEKPFSFFRQRFRVESEISLFSGDHNGITDPQSGQDRQDWGLFFQLWGKEKELPLSYRIRFEEYADDFRPEGAVITPNRRVIESHVNWLFKNGLELRGRAQFYTDNWQSSNPQDTEVFGITASGPLFFGLIKGLTGNLDVFLQNVDDEDNTVDQTTRSASLSLTFPVRRSVNARVVLSITDTDDNIQPISATIMKQAVFGLDLTPDIHGISTTISPSFSIRHTHAPNTRETDFAPHISVNMQKGAHSLLLDFSYNSQNMSPGADVDTATYTISYRYTKGKNEFGFEFGGINREPAPGRSTGSYKAFVFWTYHFESRIKSKAKETREVEAEAGRRFDPSIIKLLSPDTPTNKATELLARFGIRNPTPQGDLLIYEVRLFDEVEQRQRLVLVDEYGRLKKTAVIIYYERTGRAYDFMQTFEWIKKTLINYLGDPQRFYETGNITANLFNDINEGRFIRLYEWDAPSGIIRLGIPRRLDRRIEIEIQYAKEFPPVNYTLWGMEEVK